jgi:hypothetical protein
MWMFFNQRYQKVLEKNDLVFRLEALRDLVLFYAVLFFTCVIGIIELLPEIKQDSKKWFQILVGILYFGLVSIFDFCVFRVWGIFLESALLTRIRLEGWEAYKNYALNYPSIVDNIILSLCCSKIVVFLIIFLLTIFFSLLYYYKYFEKS